MKATRFISLQALAALIGVGIWVGSGRPVFLFIAGMAVGAAIVAAVIAWEERKNLKAEMLERTNV